MLMSRAFGPYRPHALTRRWKQRLYSLSFNYTENRYDNTIDKRGATRLGYHIILFLALSSRSAVRKTQFLKQSLLHARHEP